MTFEQVLEMMQSQYPKLMFEKVIDNSVNELRISYFNQDEALARKAMDHALRLKDEYDMDHFVVDLYGLGLEDYADE